MSETKHITPPLGRVTLMFTDVEGSTARWEQYGARYGEALQVYERLTRACIAAHNGWEVKTVGDSFMVAFARPADAVRCAAAIHAALNASGAETPLWKEMGGIRVRIGLHTGEPSFRDNDYFGPPVNRAARICDAGHGGITLLSQETARAAQEELEPEFHLEDLGLHRLKDLGQPERLYLLRHPQIPEVRSAPLRTLNALPHNFPAHLTAFVGRIRELADLTAILRGRRSRLITLIGPAGTGKTRLAIQVAADMLQEFPDGVWLIEMASVRDIEAVPTAIALALAPSLTLRPEASPRQQVIEFLRARRCLMVLDNFEQVAEAAPFLSDLLQECSGLTCLVTSRELLHLSGELEYMVEPLSVPPPDYPGTHWTEFESVQLFVERCQSLRPDFALTNETGGVVGEICRRLEGIPLAIELAAVRIRGMSPAQILQRLTRRLDLLAHGQRDLPERQRTLRAALDWSYDLLSEEEKSLFAELSVFVGGFSLESAEEVCQTPGVFDLLFQLRDKSLLRVTESRGLTRFSMLETLREYAQEKLLKQGAQSALLDRHSEHYLRLAQEWAGKLEGAGPEVAEATDVFTEEIENFRRGMDWALQCENAARTIEYARAMWRFLLRTGLLQECDARLALAEQAARRAGDSVQVARLLNQRGLVSWNRYDLAQAHRLFTESYEISRSLDDRPRMLVNLINLGNLEWGHGDFARARLTWEEGLKLAVETRQSRYEAVLRMHLGILACERGDFEEASREFAESLAIHTRNHSEESIAHIYYNSSDIFRRQGDYERAKERIEQAQSIYARLNYRRGVALTAVRLGMNYLEQGSPKEARAPAEEGLRIAREIGDRACEMYAYDVLARLAGYSGDYAEAHALFSRSLQIAREQANGKHQADVLLHYGQTLQAGQRLEEAYLLLCIAERELLLRGLADAAAAERARETIREAIGENRAQELAARAAGVSPDSALELLK
jgi:predicted ATPase/class 3 adenylate cyclase/Tfp pilus assembly protein PilF